MMDPAKSLEQLGIPPPIVKKPYEQKYKEALFRMLIPLFAAIISCAQNVPFQLACQIDIACYVATVVFLYILGIPRKFNLGNELKFLFQYFVAFVIVFVMVDNGIRTVKGLI